MFCCLHVQWCPFIFQALKSSIDECISHVIGAATPTSCTPAHHSHNSRSPLEHYPRSRGSSPSPRSRTPSYKVSRSQPDGTVTAASATTQRSLSAQNSQNDADSPSDTVDDAVIGVVVESLPVPHKGKSYGSVWCLVYFHRQAMKLFFMFCTI
jgi:hypothetical protein